MSDLDDLLARLDAESATGCSDPATCQDHWCRLAQDAAAAVRSLRDELHYLAEYTTNIHEAEAERRALSPSTSETIEMAIRVPNDHPWEK